MHEEESQRQWHDRRLDTLSLTGELSPPVVVSKRVEESTDTPWDRLASELPDWLLATSLGELELPTRMRKLAERSGLRTVAELVAVPRATLMSTKNIGRTSIRDTHAILAGRALAQRASVWADLPWDALADALPDWLLGTTLVSMELPAPLRAYAAGRGIRTVAELVGNRRWELERAEKVGPVSVERARRSLLALAATRPKAAADYDSFWELWLEKLDALRDAERTVVVQRAGIGGPPQRLRDIGKARGVTHERVRQIESRAIEKMAGQAWVADVCERLAGLLVGGVLELDALEEADPWFASTKDRHEAFGYFLERIAGGTLSLATLDRRVLVVACAANEVGTSLARARAALRALACPADADVTAAAIAKAAPPSAPGLARIIGESLECRMHRDEHGRMLSFGRERVAEVLGFLSRCPEPVSIRELEATLGARRHLPDEVFYFDFGVVGLEQHFADYATWKRRLVPICVGVMESDLRQWRVADLLDAVRERIELPEWFGVWNLAEILRRSSEVRYLNRLRVTLPGVNDGTRLQPAELAEQLLLEHGAPLPYRALLRRVTSQTMLNRSTFRQTMFQLPFVEVDEELIGLMERDVPGGARAIARFGDALAEELMRANRGLGGGRLASLLARLGGVHARWTVQMARGVARVDPRFQLPPGAVGGVGLAAWEGARVPTRAAIILDCVEEHGGRVPVRVVLDRLHAEHGMWMDRRLLGTYVYRNGLRMRGGEISFTAPR